MYLIKSYGVWSAETSIYGITFKGFAAQTKCGSRQSVFAPNPHSSDYIPMQNYRDTTFVDVEADAYAYFYDPPMKWANDEDCGNFPCTAPSNIVMKFKNTLYEGTSQDLGSTFQIVSDTASVSNTFSDCQFQD